MENIPNHIAIIMDGNRRWAKKRGLMPSLGHKEGADTLEKIAEVCEEIGINTLTVFAFSTENWKRSKEEVDYLMDLLTKTIIDFDKKFKNRNVRIKLIGDINGLPEKLQKGIIEIEEKTKDKNGLTINIAINYGGRAEIINATKEIAKQVKEGNIDINDIDEQLMNKYIYTSHSPEPDLLIRSGGEKRLSGFLIWQSAYTEYYFIDTLWPDFNKEELIKAINEYSNRKRNYGS